MILKTQRGIWETDVRNLDLTKPSVLRWYLERKIQVGDWRALEAKTLARHLPQLNIDPYLRALLNNFLKQHGIIEQYPARSSDRRRRQ